MGTNKKKKKGLGDIYTYKMYRNNAGSVTTGGVYTGRTNLGKWRI